MVKIFRYLFIFILLLPINYIYADVCDSNDIERLKELANHVEINYSYDQSEPQYDGENYNKSYNLYNISIYNLVDDIYIVNDNEDVFRVSDAVNGIITDYAFAGNRNYYVYSTNCEGILLRTIRLDLKKFNVYSEYDECKGLEGKVYVCDKWYQGNLDYATFISEIEKYKKDNDSGVNDHSNNSYYIFIIGGVLLVIFFLVFVFIRRKRSVLE